MEGLTQAQISTLLFRTGRTISRWLKDFSIRRIASIFCGHVDNENANKLTRAQKNEIKKALKSPPSDYGLPNKFWDVPQLKNYVEARFGAVFERDFIEIFLSAVITSQFNYPFRYFMATCSMSYSRCYEIITSFR